MKCSHQVAVLRGWGPAPANLPQVLQLLYFLGVMCLTHDDMAKASAARHKRSPRLARTLVPSCVYEAPRCTSLLCGEVGGHLHDPKPYAVPCLCSSLPPCCELSWALCSLSWPSPTGGSDCVYSRIDWVRESGGEKVWSCWLEVSLTACAMATRSRASWGQSPLLDSCPDPS